MGDSLESLTGANLPSGLGELDDTTERPAFSLARIDVGLLTSPAVLRAAGGIVVGLTVLVWQDRSDRILARLIGLGLVWLAITGFRAAIGRGRRDWLRLVQAVATMAVGVFLFLNPDGSTTFLGRTLGVLLIGYALRIAYHWLRADGRDWARLASVAVMATIGLLMTVSPDSLFSIIIDLGALWLIGISVLTLIVSLDARTHGTATYSDTGNLVVGWLRDRPKSVDARQDLYQKILYEGPTTQTRVVRFFTLMGFAAVIASMGVMTDSTAVVIGAMLVAPLMTPLMGMAISLVMGWPNRLLRSSLLALGGIVFAIAIGTFLGLVVNSGIDTTTNSQILARISPTTLDLITAIAAGAAGAYGLSRPDVSDSLPGVAIAISLVPPLAVVGISYSQGDWRAGNGALLLFATNMIAILLVGGLTFIITGVTPLAQVADNQRRVRTALGVTVTAAVLVLGGLLLNGAQVATDILQTSTVEENVQKWLSGDSGHRVINSSIEGDRVAVVVIGPSEGLPEPQDLADALSEDLDKDVTVAVSLVVEERIVATSG